MTNCCLFSPAIAKLRLLKLEHPTFLPHKPGPKFFFLFSWVLAGHVEHMQYCRRSIQFSLHPFRIPSSNAEHCVLPTLSHHLLHHLHQQSIFLTSFVCLTFDYSDQRCDENVFSSCSLSSPQGNHFHAEEEPCYYAYRESSNGH